MRLCLVILLAFACKSRTAAQPLPKAKQSQSQSQVQRAQRQTAILEVAPASLPSAQPLLGPEGRDADGYPTRYVDRPALRSLLWHKHYAALSEAFEQFQTAFETDYRNEYFPIDAGDTFDSAEPSLRARLDEWVAATPDSFAPWLARANHLQAVAGARRGEKWAAETPRGDFQAMEEVLPQAMKDAEHALELRPKLVAAMRVQLILLRYQSLDRARRKAIIDRALAVCPGCFQIRVTYLYSVTPRWGGSYEEMAAFGKPGKGKLRFLPGYVDDDKADALELQKHHPEALVAIERACALGDHWEFIEERGVIRELMGDLPGALADLNRAAALRPGYPSILFRRAEIENQQRDWEAAGRDLLEGLRSAPTSSTARNLHETVVQGLAYLGWTAHQAGHREEALRFLDLAAALAPNDKDVGQRRAAAIIGAPENAGDTSQLEDAVARHPDDFRAVQQLDYAWDKQGGKSDRIVAMWTRYLQLRPNDGPAYMERAGAYHRLRKLPEALADAGKACELGVTKGCEVVKRGR